MEELEQNKKVYIYSYIISFIVILGLFSLFIYKSNENKKPVTNNVVNTNNSTSNEEKTIDVDIALNSWDYEWAITEIEKKWTGSLEREEKMKLVYSYLNYGNYFYKEEENSKKAMDILNTMDDDYNVLYNKWYSQEIIKNYTGALDYYNKWLEITTLSNEQKSTLKNQIGHLYDLKWEFDKVFAYYDEAYKLDENNASALSNLWRYYARIWKYDNASELLNKSLKLTTNLPSKSEISFSLSSIELELNWLTPDIDKSIDYARQSIEYYPSYAMWYVALARWLYMKNDSQYDQEIEDNLNKSIELNPDWYYAYELYTLYEYDKWNMEKMKEFLQKSLKVIDKDMLLMDSEREKTTGKLFFVALMLWYIKYDPENQERIIDFFEKNNWQTNWIILFQVKRNNYWIFKSLKDDEKFKEILSKYNK